MSGLLFLYKQGHPVRPMVGGGTLSPTGFENTFLPLKFPFHKLEVGDVLDGDVSHYEQELAQFKGVPAVASGAIILCPLLCTFEFWLRGRLLVLIHPVRIICARVRKIDGSNALLSESSSGKVPDDGVTELFRFLCKGIDRVDRLFSHSEPIG